MLAGETSVDGGELSLRQGHAGRPARPAPAARARPRCATTCSRLRSCSRSRSELARSSRDGRGRHDAATLDAYARAQARLEHAGGYNWREGVNATLHGLGFRDEDLDRPLETFSGGELTRASLARALAGDPDLLLLDEPTNHLDIESLEWLETHLQTLDAAVVLVAHDRWFLEAVGTSVLELEGGRSRFFKGTWHAWRKEKARASWRSAARSRSSRPRSRKLERFVDRFRAGTRASRRSRAQEARQDRADRARPARRQGARLRLQAARALRPRRLRGEDGRSIGDRELLDDAELWLERGEHVSLVGPNGTGKTTLIDTLTGEREARRGKLRRGPQRQARPALPARRGARRQGDGAGGTVLEAAQRATGLKPNEARSLLGRFLFSGEDGREAARRAVRRRAAAPVARDPRALRANVLILDEPTNHLDLESREALEAALQAFPGSLLLVSHDRALLDAVGTARSRSRTARCAPTSAAGRSTCACARSARRPSGRPSAPSRGRRRGDRRAPPTSSRNRPRRRTRSAGRRIEAEIGAAEGRSTRRGGARRPGCVERPAQRRQVNERHERRQARSRSSTPSGRPSLVQLPAPRQVSALTRRGCATATRTDDFRVRNVTVAGTQSGKSAWRANSVFRSPQAPRSCTIGHFSLLRSD